MSLLRSPDSATSSYGQPNLYARRSSGDDPVLSNQIFSSDKQMFLYGLETSRSPSYAQHYFAGPSSAPSQHVSIPQITNSAVPRSSFNAQVASNSYQLMANTRSSIVAENPYSSCFDPRPESSASSNVTHQTTSSLSQSQSPDLEMNYDEDEIRLKIQELERSLLDDNEYDFVDLDSDMGIDEDWVGPIKNLLLPNSPKESSDSNLSNSDSSRELRTVKQLLFDCATAVSEGSMEEARALVTELRQMVSIQGDPPQRVAAYMVEGLAARMSLSGQGLYKALRCKEPPTSDRLSAMQVLFESCPCFKFGFMAANGAIAEALKGEERVHIIDFDINQGSQYMTLIQALSSRSSKPRRLRITGVDDPESVQRSVGGLKIIGQRLEKLAEDARVPFEFRAIAAKIGDVTPTMLDCQPGEALVVNFAFQLHHMPDESVSTVNQRDQLLRMVKGMGPKLVTVVEQDVNTNTSPFFPRFMEVYNYYSAIFDSLDATLPRDSADRMNVERQCLARDIVNIVACEGADRIERYEAAGKWRARMMMAGFSSCPLSSYVNEAIRGLLKSYCNRYKVKEEAGALYFGWEEKMLVVASAWK